MVSIHQEMFRLSLRSSQVSHQTGGYPDFHSMKRLKVFPIFPGWDANTSQGYPPALNLPIHIYTRAWVKRGTMRVKCLVQEHNAVHQPELESGSLQPESSALTIRPGHHNALGQRTVEQLIILLS